MPAINMPDNKTTTTTTTKGLHGRVCNIGKPSYTIETTLDDGCFGDIKSRDDIYRRHKSSGVLIC